MSDVRDEQLAAVLDRVATAIQAEPIDRLPAVIRRGSRRRKARLGASVVLVAVFAGAVSWAGLSIRADQTIPADIADWRTFASLEENGWTIQVPPSWRIQELPACPNAPHRIGVVVTNSDFDFRNPQGERPACGDRYVFAGFPPNGVAFAFQPNQPFGLLFGHPETVLPLSPTLLHTTSSIRGGPSERYVDITAAGRLDPLAYVRRWVGPEASRQDVAALDRLLGSLRVSGTSHWVTEERTVGGLTIEVTQPDRWRTVTDGLPSVIDAPTPVLEAVSPGLVDGGSCRPFISAPWIHLTGFRNFGVAVVVSDGSGMFGPPDLGERPELTNLREAIRRSVGCGNRVRALRLGFQAAGRPIYVDLAASDTFFREKPETLRYILDRIEISKA
jgi:hypothetical protein